MRIRALVLSVCLAATACVPSSRLTVTVSDEGTMGETATPTRLPEPDATEAGPPPPVQEPMSLALVNGTLIDGTGRDPLPDAVIVIEQGRITAVGTATEVTIPPDVPTIDVRGATILPGFINAHVHQAYDRDALAAWAQSGVTTVRDLGSRDEPATLFAFRDEVAQDPRYARLVATGPLVSVPDGYGHAAVTSPEDARRMIAALLGEGADLIKIAIEDNLQGRTWVMLSAEEIRAIVETAHASGTLVVAHVSRSSHVELALQTGVDDVTHMVVDDLSSDLAVRLAHAGMVWEPTLELWQCATQLHSGGMDRVAIENLRRFSEAGGRVALGTDYAGYRCEFELGMPVTEIDLMHRAGMTPMQIIVAATQNAAYVCNLGDELGTLEPGKIADVLVVDGDPLEDLGALTDVRMVIHGGSIIRE